MKSPDQMYWALSSSSTSQSVYTKTDSTLVHLVMELWVKITGKISEGGWLLEAVVPNLPIPRALQWLIFLIT